VERTQGGDVDVVTDGLQPREQSLEPRWKSVRRKPVGVPRAVGHAFDSGR
jgi:hypothetical protein